MLYLIEVWNAHSLPVFIYLIVASISVGMSFNVLRDFEGVNDAFAQIGIFGVAFCVGYYLDIFTSVMFETDSGLVWMFALIVKIISLVILYLAPFLIFAIYSAEENLHHKFHTYHTYLASSGLIFCIGFGSFFAYHELTLSPEMKIARAETAFRAEKQALEEAHEAELKEARAEVKVAEIEEKRRALYGDKSHEREHQEKLAQLRERASQLQAKGVDYSSLSRKSKNELKPQEPIDGQLQLILSALWLGACFFLQRIFEKLFHDKGYALLAVCAAGFMLAFFSANYFLLGGSVTGGLMGSTGKSGA